MPPNMRAYKKWLGEQDRNYRESLGRPRKKEVAAYKRADRGPKQKPQAWTVADYRAAVKVMGQDAALKSFRESKIGAAQSNTGKSTAWETRYKKYGKSGRSK